MTVISSYDDLITRVGTGHTSIQPIGGLAPAVNTGTTLGTIQSRIFRIGNTASLGSLPSGVTAFIPTAWSMIDSYTNNGDNTCTFALVEMINLGSLDISGPTFTDGSVMPTRTCLNASMQMAGPVWVEVTTALNATPGNITVSYHDQDNNADETTTAQSLQGSSNIGDGGFIQLNNYDSGVVDLTTTATTRTGGTTPTGVIKFWGILPIGVITMPACQTSPVFENLITQGFMMRRLPANTTLGVFMFGKSVADNCHGTISFVGDS